MIDNSTLAKIVQSALEDAWASADLPAKAAWDEDAHPRHAAGRSEGGRFAPKGGGASTSEKRTAPPSAPRAVPKPVVKPVVKPGVPPGRPGVPTKRSPAPAGTGPGAGNQAQGAGAPARKPRTLDAASIYRTTRGRRSALNLAKTVPGSPEFKTALDAWRAEVRSRDGWLHANGSRVATEKEAFESYTKPGPFEGPKAPTVKQPRAAPLPKKPPREMGSQRVVMGAAPGGPASFAHSDGNTYTATGRTGTSNTMAGVRLYEMAFTSPTGDKRVIWVAPGGKQVERDEEKWSVTAT